MIIEEYFFAILEDHGRDLVGTANATCIYLSNTLSMYICVHKHVQ